MDTLYILRNKATGLFYNGTNFNAKFGAEAQLVVAASEAEAVRVASLVWAGAIEAIPMAPTAGVGADAIHAVKMKWAA